jgi:hypothetical protein
MMAMNILLLLAIVGAASFFSWPKIAKAQYWRAMITPLASIIGSGFLVIGPILLDSFGSYAPVAMASLCLAAFAFGHAIRYNIRRLETVENESRLTTQLDFLSDWALAFAYIVSVAYYLNLFGAFAVSLTPMNSEINAKLVTSAVFIFIVGIGLQQGFGALERLEQVSVSLKLAIITGLLTSLVWVALARTASGGIDVEVPELSPWASISLLFGLIVTVQGFETSRYLGGAYSSSLREKTMRSAQLASMAIYLIYIICISFVFSGEEVPLTETAIIGLMAQVSPILPGLLVIAALASQFSAGIADTGGSGGLFEELTRGRLKARQSYLLIGGVGLFLTWGASVFDIISYASRAFAVYYALQASVAALRARRCGDLGHFAGYLILAALGASIALFGAAVAA